MAESTFQGKFKADTKPSLLNSNALKVMNSYFIFVQYPTRYEKRAFNMMSIFKLTIFVFFS